MKIAELNALEQKVLLETIPEEKAIYLSADLVKSGLPIWESYLPGNLLPRKIVEAVCQKLPRGELLRLSTEAAQTASEIFVHEAWAVGFAASFIFRVHHVVHHISRISPEVVNEAYEQSLITIPKAFVTNDIKLMLDEAWDKDINTLPYIADALEEQNFSDLNILTFLRNDKFYGRSHGIFNHENT